jgi:hypothetical protein
VVKINLVVLRSPMNLFGRQVDIRPAQHSNGAHPMPGFVREYESELE